jgi:quercetin dioxygenase-like cupin family protein
MRLLVAVSAVTLALGCAQSGVNAVNPGEVEWAPGPRPGTQVATLAGDPAGGPHLTLTKIAGGTTVDPHVHPADEVLVVVSGSARIGEGGAVDEAKGHAVDAGGHLFIPANLPHWFKAVSDVVVVRYGSGPLTTLPAAQATAKPAAGAALKCVASKDVAWGAAPGLPPTAQAAVVYGSPEKGASIVLMKSAGVTVPPHWHSGDEIGVVLSGGFTLGDGETVDEAKAHKIAPGGFFRTRATAPHWGRGEGLFLRYTAVALDIHFCNPADDPRNKK